MDKRKTTLAVIGVAVLLVALVGTTYAFWTLNGAPSTSASATVQTGGLILRLDDVNGITSNDVIDPNHLSFSKYFSITNESAADGYAKLMFKDLVNTFVTDALVYDLEEVQSDKTSFATPRMIITNAVLPKSATSTNATLADGLLIEHGAVGANNTVTATTKYYKLIVRYNYSDTIDQSDDLNKVLTSGFTMEEGQSSVTMSVSFNTNDTNIAAPSNISVTMGSTYGTLPNPTKSGYKVEWYTDSLLTEKVESTSVVTKSGNHTLYAKWVEKKSIACVDASGNEIACPATLAIGQRMKIGDQYFRYIRTTNTSDTTNTYNECNDGGSSSIACTDADSRHPLENNKLRLLAEYNLNVGSNKNASVTEGIQHESIKGWLSSGTKYGNIAYGASNNNYSESNVKTYTENYASYLNTTYFGGSSEVTGSAITRSELTMLGCPSGTSTGTCASTYPWVYTTTYWSGSPVNANSVWGVDSDAYLSSSSYSSDYGYGVRPVISISASSI